MGGIFNINSPFFRVMSKVFDVIVLSLLWTLCCIPVITIGPATTALYYAIVKSIRKDRGWVDFNGQFVVCQKPGQFVWQLFMVRISGTWYRAADDQPVCLSGAFPFYRDFKELV